MAVRKEKVVLELDDRFSSGMARAAAAAALLNRELESMDGNSRTSERSMRRNATTTDNYANSLAGMNTHLRESNSLLGGLNGNGRNGLGGFNNNANSAGRSINQLTGRLRLFADAAAMLGPALMPIGALAVPALSGLASQLGIAAVAGASTMLAFQGVADAFKAVGKAADAPSLENIRAAQIAMEGLAPAAQEFVTKLQEMRGEFAGFRNAAAQGLFAELNDDFDHMEGVLDRLTPVVHAFGAATGDMLGDGLTSLDSQRWQDFYTFLEAEARPAMEQMGQTLGNFGHGLAELWMGMDPFNDSFSTWMLNVSKSFDGWAEGLSQTAGFTEFLDYVKTTGPQVGDTMGALGNAFLQIAEAMAPIGGPVLAVLEDVFDVIGNIADSDIGTPLLAGAAAMAALSRASMLFGATSRTMAAQQAALRGRITATSGAFRAFGADVRAAANFGAMNAAQMNAQTAAAARVRASLMQVGKVAATSAAGVGLMAVAMSDADNKAGIANTAMLGLAGTMIGGPWGAAIGVAIGGTMDLAAANDDLEDAIKRAEAAMRSGGPTQMQAAITSLREQIRGAAEDSEDLKNFLSFKPTDKGYFEETGGAIKGFVNVITGAGDEAKQTLTDLESKLNSTGMGSLFASGINMTADSFNNATRSAADFAAALEKVNAILSGRASWRDYAASLREAADALAQNGKGLNIFTEKGAANQAALDNIASSALKVAENLKGMNRIQFLDRARDRFIEMATGMGMGEKAAAKLATQMELLDRTEVKPTIDVDAAKAQAGMLTTNAFLTHLNQFTARPKAILQDLASGKIKGVQGLINKYGATRAQAQALLRDLASGNIAAVRASLAALDGTSATTYITTVRRVVGGGSDFVGGAFNNVFGAEGAFYPKVGHYAKGDVRNGHEAEVARGGTWRVWAEDETQGESYIPHANDHRRPRAKSILEETAAILGGNVEWYATGGSTGAAAKKRAAAAKAFDLSGGLGVAGVRREMNEFERALNKMGVKTGRHFDRLGKQAEQLSASWLKANRALDAAKQRRDDVRSSASGSFNNDLFGNGLAGLRTQLEADRNDASAMSRLLVGLRAKGLDGALYEGLAGSGDLNTAQQLSQLSRAELGQYEKLMAQRSASQQNLGNVAVLGINKEIAAHTAVLARLGKKIDGIEAAVERGSRRGSHDGSSKGVRDRDRDKNREIRGRGRVGR